MSRQDPSKKGKQSGRQGGNGKKFSGRQGGKARKGSYARGNSPVKSHGVQKSAQLAPDEMRLNKYISNSGICSRRDADIYIASGNVTVNGKPVTELGYKVKLDDEVRFDGKLINPDKPEYILLNKPKGFSSTPSSNMEKQTVMNLLGKAAKGKIQPVDRLERNTTGLILFTNDVKLAQKLSDPKSRVKRIYHLALDRNLKHEDLKKIEKGIRIGGHEVPVDDISYVDDSSKREVGIKVSSGKHSTIKKLFQELGYEIIKFDRVVFADLTKKDIPRGTWRVLNRQEIINLKML
ncbi:pseudouridine synthase [Robertkochia aurantiaca]|uniref:pseudouridine synthase n=1 Tax=Robertkochia aurantiaca TaxID=2873700 RepID=UPI001CCA2DB0|nr:pseudouridine synthase [Robertkochia sp. 3YJGBD-33]